MKLLRFLLPAMFTLVTGVQVMAQSGNAQLDDVLNHTLDSMRTVLNVKSLGAAIQLPDNAVWAGATGISSVFPAQTVTPAHTYAIGSVTKTITAATVLQLVDEGLLHLDDSLHQWLDTLPFVNPNITVRQLLRHQSGLYDVITDPDYSVVTQTDVDSIWQLKDVVTTFIHAPIFQPGAGWSYCNTNYLLLGMIIEAVTGKPYYQENRERFFAPLSIGSLAIPPYDPLPASIAHVWLDITGDGVTDDANNFFTHWRSFFTTAGPAGGYFATPADIAKWMKAFMTGSLHSAGIMAQAKTTVATSLPAGTKYGLGLMERKFYALTGYGHGGDIGYSSLVYYFPSKDISVAVLNNDSKNNSWTLAPVMTALLKAYVTFQAASSVSDPAEKGLNTTVYPNPFSDNMTVSFDLPVYAGEIRLELSNALGEKITEKQVVKAAGGRQEIALADLENLPSGVYFLSAWLDGRLAETAKVFK